MGRQFLSFFRSVGPGDMAGAPLFDWEQCLVLLERGAFVVCVCVERLPAKSPRREAGALRFS